MNSENVGYHLGMKGRQTGPFSETEVLHKIASRELEASDLCWRDGWENWKPVRLAFPQAFANTGSDFPPPIPQLVTTTAVRIEGQALVVPKDQPFPAICIRTGATEDLLPSPINCKLSWHHPAAFFALLLNILIYLVIAMVISKKSTHAVYLSRPARAVQIKWHLANWGIFIAMLVAFGVAITKESGGLALLGTTLLIAAITIYFLKVRLLYAARIDKVEARIRGIRPEVMEKLVQAWR